MERDAQRLWLTPYWATSRHNFAAEIAVPAQPVVLHDLTIRDGEECADLAYTTADKIRIAEALARLGIKRTEVFLTVPGWTEMVRGLLSRNLGMELWVTWQPGRVERAWSWARSISWSGTGSAKSTSSMCPGAAVRS
jgi:hypothetical protein